MIDGAPQAVNHPMIKAQPGICACRVIRGFPGRRAALPGSPANSIPLFSRWPFPIRVFRRALGFRCSLSFPVRQMLLDRDIVACDTGHYARSQSYMGFPANARGPFSVQAPADGHEQLGNAQTVTETLAFSQAPVRYAYHALVTVAECPPDHMPKSQLPTDRSQLVPRGLQQLLPKPVLQLPTHNVIRAAFDVVRHATPIEDGQTFIKPIEDGQTLIKLVRVRQQKFWVGDHL